MVKSPRPDSAVSLPRLVPSADKHKETSAVVSLGEYEGTMKVLIEYCQRCYRHPWYVHHNEEKYFTQFMDIAGRISQAFPEVGEIVDVKDPRIGALEITVVNGTHQQVVFSKLQSGRWPNVSNILDRIRRVAHRMVTSEGRDSLLVENEFLTSRHHTVAVHLAADAPVPFVLGLEITDKAPFLVTVVEEGKYGAECGVARRDILHCINGKACDRMDLDELFIELRKRPMSLYCRRFDHTNKARRQVGGPITFTRLFGGRPTSGRVEKAAAIHRQRQRMGMATIPRRPSPSLRLPRPMKGIDGMHGSAIVSGYSQRSAREIYGAPSKPIQRRSPYDARRQQKTSEMVMHNRGDESSRRTVRKADAGSRHSVSRELEGESDVSVHGHVEPADVEARGLKGSDGKSSNAKRDDGGSVTLPTTTRRTGKTGGRSAQKAALASKSRVAKGKNAADKKNDYEEDSESWDGGGPNAVQATAITTDRLQSISEAHTSTADAHTHGPGDASSDADNESIGAEEAQKTGADEGGVIGSQSSSVAGDAYTAAVNDTERSPVENDVGSTETPSQTVGVAVDERATTEGGGASGSPLADLNREKERTEVVATSGIEDSEPGENPEIPPIADESVAGDTAAKNGERESVGVDGNPEGADETTKAENNDDNDTLVEATNDATASGDTEGVGQEESSQPSPSGEAAKPAEDDTLPADGSEESEVAKEDSEENIPSEDDVPEEPKANLMSREEEVWGGAGDPPRPPGEFESGTRPAKDGREPPHFDVNATSPTKFREHAN